MSFIDPPWSAGVLPSLMGRRHRDGRDVDDRWLAFDPPLIRIVFYFSLLRPHRNAMLFSPSFFIIIIIIIFIPFHHWALDWTCTAQHTAHTRWWRHCVLLHNPLLFTVAFVWSIHQVFSFSLNKKKDDIRSILKFNVETINNYSPQRRKKKN